MPLPAPHERPLVAIAGASGFVGTRLRAGLGELFRWRALTRSASAPASSPRDDATEWRRCDLFSPPRMEDALAGCRQGIYLVHSMLPSSRLVQGSFEDMDLLLADNFARAARAAGLEHIVYLGGLLPEDDATLSPHLASRREVEGVLRQSGLPVTVLRAGLIFGPGGSSTRMLLNLVRRLPLMSLPRWTRRRAGSVDVRDVVSAFRLVLTDASLRGGTYDLATHRPMSYEEMILGAGAVLGRRPRVVRLPVNAITLSRFWVRCFSGVPSTLVGPLMESLTHDLPARDNPLLARLRASAISFEQSVRESVDAGGRPAANPRARSQRQDRAELRHESRVRSVQRMVLPAGWDAPRVAEAYGRWLTRSFLTALFVEQKPDGSLRFVWRLPRLPLLELTPTPHSRADTTRRAFYITGGALARPIDPPGRFEFRVFPDAGCVVAAIHGYAPRLPWYVYEATQALVHLAVMRAFGAHLRAEARSGGPTPSVDRRPPTRLAQD
jgi:uncharacterized protein YbjT (DUF2867 family)